MSKENKGKQNKEKQKQTLLSREKLHVHTVVHPHRHHCDEHQRNCAARLQRKHRNYANKAYSTKCNRNATRCCEWQTRFC